jgi:hypothetical protein
MSDIEGLQVLSRSSSCQYHRSSPAESKDDLHPEIRSRTGKARDKFGEKHWHPEETLA